DLDPFIGAVGQTGDGAVIAVTIDQVVRWRGDRQEILAGTGGGAIATAPDGSAWLALSGVGLAHLSSAGMTTFTTREGLPFERIVGVAADRDDSIWFCGNKGIGHERGGGFETLSTRQGLPIDDVSAIV